MAKRLVQVGRFAGTYGSLISPGELDRITPKVSEPGYVDPNPCVKLFGQGPSGATCKSCTHLTRSHYAHIVLKCDQRPDLTHSKATDQKAGWNACKRFEPGENRQHYPSH